MLASARMGSPSTTLARSFFSGTLAVAFALLLPRCSADDCPRNTESCPRCPAVADACPSGCDAMTAYRFDFERKCQAAAAVVGCRPPRDVTPANAPCVVRVRDGSLFAADSSAGFSQEGWRPCSDEELARVHDTTFTFGCPP